jgi:hypothetical protein
MGQTFQLFFTHLIKNGVQVLNFNKITLVKKNKDKMAKEYLVLHISSLTAYSTIKL